MNQSEKRILLLAALLLAMLVSGCGPKPVKTQTQTPPPQPKPVTANLSASPTSIQRGQSSTLTWSTENADNVTLQGAKVDASGSQSVSPTRSTDYHLIATGPGGTQDATARVTVAEQTTTTTTTTTQTDEEIFNASVQDIYFDYDRADLRPDAQQSLARAAQVISQHSNWRVRIEGNCDERGSTEYNLSLGEERASAARQALSQGGVGGDRLQSISFGKEKPVCTESTEDCWQKNRHDHFVLLK
ncbi:MAG TPA: OmpA family protein [Candidatus Angelobacter sp.]